MGAVPGFFSEPALAAAEATADNVSSVAPGPTTLRKELAMNRTVVGRISWAVVLAAAALAVAEAKAEPPREIGSRLELFVDDWLIDRLDGARQVLHRPEPREVAIVHDAPWEGNACLYHTVFQDGELYRMYYRGSHFEVGETSLRTTHAFACYAESRDGIHWTKPELGLVEFEGSSKNNIILTGPAVHNFSPFKDTNPDCKPDERYKGLGGVGGGLRAYKSPDAVHWSPMTDKPVITKGAFDSQNIAFWDPVRGQYREYHRAFRAGRDIMTGTSDDFLDWTGPEWLDYDPARLTQLYTNQIIPYPRAPHIFLGFPARYVAGRTPLGPLNERIARISKRFGTDYTDTGLMTSRDGGHFHVWPEAFIRPGIQTGRRWVYGGKYTAWGIVQTRSHLPDAPEVLSFYTSDEGYWEDHVTMRRYTLRIDGFVSIEAPLSGGELVTRPLVFSGSELVLNFSTSAAGSVRVEIQDESGQAIEGFTLADCPEIYGDAIERVISWKGGPDVTALAGKPVRLRFVLKDADVYAFRFRE